VVRPVRVFVVDDHPMVRDGLVSLLQGDDAIDVVGAAGTLAEAVAGLADRTVDVVMTDHRLPDGTGLDLARALGGRESTIRVLLVTGHERPGLVEEAVRAGCRGFMTKSHDTGAVIGAIHAIARDEAVFPADAVRRLARTSRSPGADLSERELEVLRRLAASRSVEEIAADLFVSVHTVRNHVRAILVKLGAHSQLEAVILAVRAGIVDIT
jgi:DNA-binding NarL/FixJ family response regulator